MAPINVRSQQPAAAARPATSRREVYVPREKALRLGTHLRTGGFRSPGRQSRAGPWLVGRPLADLRMNVSSQSRRNVIGSVRGIGGLLGPEGRILGAYLARPPTESGGWTIRENTARPGFARQTAGRRLAFLIRSASTDPAPLLGGSRAKGIWGIEFVEVVDTRCLMGRGICRYMGRGTSWQSSTGTPVDWPRRGRKKSETPSAPSSRSRVTQGWVLGSDLDSLIPFAFVDRSPSFVLRLLDTSLHTALYTRIEPLKPDACV